MAKVKVPIIISTKRFIIPKSQGNENVIWDPTNQLKDFKELGKIFNTQALFELAHKQIQDKVI